MGIPDVQSDIGYIEADGCEVWSPIANLDARNRKLRNKLGMRESGYSLSPLYLKPVLIVGKFVCPSVCPCVRLSAGMLNVSIFFRYLREFVKGES